MKLENLGVISTGNVIARLNSDKPSTTYEIFTLQNINYILGQYDVVPTPSLIEVADKKCDKVLFAEKNDVIISLASNRAIVVENATIGKVVTAYFGYVKCDTTKLNPYFLCWYFNHHPDVKKYLSYASQGSSLLKVITIQYIKNLEIILPTLEQQTLIGTAYKKQLDKSRLLYERIELEKKLFNFEIVEQLNLMEGDKL